MNLRTFFMILVLLLISAALFYLLYPKYYFPSEGFGQIRCNRIIGTTEMFSRTTGKWEPFKTR